MTVMKSRRLIDHLPEGEETRAGYQLLMLRTRTGKKMPRRNGRT
jgi:hypothetical protein